MFGVSLWKTYKTYRGWGSLPYLYPPPRRFGYSLRRRDASSIANRRLAERRLPTVNYRFRRLSLSEIEDRRRFGQEQNLPFRTVYNKPARFKIIQPTIREKQVKKIDWVPSAIGFLNPTSVAVCIRRKQRREIMHAKGYAGGSVKLPTFNEASFVRC